MLLGAVSLSGIAAEAPLAVPLSPQTAETLLTVASDEYVLRQGDKVQVKVFQEDDLTSLSQIGKEGMLTMPLIGPVKVVSNSVAEATKRIRELLAKDYLVNPQVTLTVIELAKRRFSVLGAVQRPQTYEIPQDESVSLLQAVAMAGGYNRLGNPHNVTVSRIVDGQKKTFRLDADKMASEKGEKPFEIQPDDVIVVKEKSW